VLALIASLIEREVLFMSAPYAIIVTGGKQYKVSEGDVIFVEKLDVQSGDTYTFDNVLAFSDDNGFKTGEAVSSCTVAASVLKQGKNKKIHIIRYKSKKNEKKAMGHRQPYTKLQIKSIQG